MKIFLRCEKEPIYAEIAWEEQAYWLRGAYPLAILTNSKRLKNVLQRYTDAILGSMQQDGWFGPLCLKDPEKKGIPDV